MNHWVAKAEQQNKVLGVKLPIQEEDSEPWKLSPSHKLKEISINKILPKQVTLVLGNQIFIDKSDLPAALQSRIISLAAFQNPEFYKNQAMRLSTFGIPELFPVPNNFLGI